MIAKKVSIVAEDLWGVGDVMNEKEAREIFEIDGSCMSNKGWEAKGYLEAIEKAKILEAGLHNMATFTNNYTWQIYKDALAQWERQK